VINGADLLHLVGDELVALVEKQDAEVLALGEGLRGPAIVEHRRPGRQSRTLFHRAAQEPVRRRLHDLKFGDAGLAEPLDLGEARRRCGDRLRERAEFRH
jgi:hypothetical protein